jgi:hypothetical protein
MLVLALLFSLAASALPFPDPCCLSHSGEGFRRPGCICLTNDAATEVFHLEAGNSMHFHWRVEDLELVNQPDKLRPWLSIATSACWGQFATHVSGLAINFPSYANAWYSSNGTQGYSLLRFGLAHSSYLISVTSMRSGNFSLVASTSGGLLPIPLNEGRIDVQQTSESSIKVQFRPSISKTRVTYGVFYQRFENTERIVSVADNDMTQCAAKQSGPCAPERAIMHTACGLRRNAILSGAIDAPRQDQVSAASASSAAHSLTRGDNAGIVAGELLSFAIDNLPLGVPIFVNVLAQGEQFDRAYEGQLVQLSFGRVVSLFGSQFTLSVAGAACAIVFLLLSVAAWTRSEIQRAVVHF